MSRFADRSLPAGGLTATIVRVLVEGVRDGRQVAGYGFSSIGRFARSDFIGTHLASRLLSERSQIDPILAWNIMMQDHRDRDRREFAVTVGTIDMALWDAAAKLAGLPLYRYIGEVLGRKPHDPQAMRIYAAGGYRYPRDDIAALRQELRSFLRMGYTHVKIKIGGAPLEEDVRRIETAIEVTGEAGRVAVDAMNAYTREEALQAAKRLEHFGLWWLEDICAASDLQTLAQTAASYRHAIAAGEPLFSVEQADELARRGSLRPDRDVLLFDPVHCYGLPGYLRIVELMERAGWARSAFWPHGGHLFARHVVAALGLGGAEANPSAFLPFGGNVRIGDVPGIGFEQQSDLNALFRSLDGLTGAPTRY